MFHEVEVEEEEEEEEEAEEETSYLVGKLLVKEETSSSFSGDSRIRTGLVVDDGVGMVGNGNGNGVSRGGRITKEERREREREREKASHLEYTTTWSKS
uniref:Uncharacterized protein n=1 Tax=Vespula pensylvanica TaxID=30213 RepID=A0A834P4N6_VESPE|nr:hypothetical protein H0235_007352 [Vespula pensylvanica]